MNRILHGVFRGACRRVMAVASLLLFTSLPLRAQTNDPVKMPPPAPRRPPVILIIADNIGFGDLGCYGQTKIKTPNLDRLAAEGVRFTDYYAGSPENDASRAALFSGMQPWDMRTNFNQALPAGAPTIASFLKNLGYHTGLIGEWNLGDTGATTPDKRGFDEFAGFLSANHAQDYYTDRIWRHDPARGDAMMTFPENADGKRGIFMPDSLATWAGNFVRIHQPELLNHYQPFFLCLSYPIPHVSMKAAPPGQSHYADAPWPPLERTRASLISHMDAGIGQLLDKLDKLKISTNTIVIFTSIAGPHAPKAMGQNFFNSTGSLRGGEGSVYEGGIRVPLIIRWPAQISGGRTINVPSAAWDLFPTIAEAAYAKPPKKLDGVSLLPALTGSAKKEEPRLFVWSGSDSSLAARLADWKIVRTNSTAPFELYDLTKDPAEKENLAQKKSAEVKRIEKAIQAAK